MQTDEKRSWWPLSQSERGSDVVMIVQCISMEKEEEDGGGGKGGAGFWWVAGGVTQLAIATVAYRRGCGDALMPVKAFGVASLYVGAAACALGGVLHHSGIHQVTDLVRLGESIRRRLGVPPRRQS